MSGGSLYFIAMENQLNTKENEIVDNYFESLQQSFNYQGQLVEISRYKHGEVLTLHVSLWKHDELGRFVYTENWHEEVVEVLAQSSFNDGADIMRGQERVFRVSPCQYWDDGSYRVIVRNGNAIAQQEISIFENRRQFFTGKWKDIKNLGPSDGLTVVYDRDEDE